MSAVVEDDVLQIRRLLIADNRQPAHVHDDRAIAIQAVHGALRLGQRDPESNLRRMAHAADRAEVGMVR